MESLNFKNAEKRTNFGRCPNYYDSRRKEIIKRKLFRKVVNLSKIGKYEGVSKSNASVVLNLVLTNDTIYMKHWVLVSHRFRSRDGKNR